MGNAMALKFTKNASVILEKRYLKKDENGKIIETPEALLTRVARTIALADTIFDTKAAVKQTEQHFFHMLSNLWFLPNSPTLMNAGRKLGQLAACFVLPIQDSMESIFEALKQTAMIHKSGGGTGFSFSKIRPENDIVLSTAGVSSGPLSFMTVFDMATETVKQGGTRRGANMGVLRVDHPDIEDFINSKHNFNRLNNFNISVALTDKFMEALENGTDYDLVNPRTGTASRKASALNIFNLIVNSAWNSGEPGVIFIDRINQSNPTPSIGEIESTNPCGEQPLLPYESCTLGSINLSKMIIKDTISYTRLRNTVHRAVHFLDNVIEINKYPLPQIEKMSKDNRKIGLGIMGFADMLIKLGIPYDTDKAVETAQTVMAFLQKESKAASAKLAKNRGNFANYKGSIFDTPQPPFMRNATTTTIAPTGTISLLADTSSGIEPIFAVTHVRHVLNSKKLPQTHPLFLDKAKKEGIYSNKLCDEIAKTGSIQSIDKIPNHIKRLFVTSHDINAQWHIKIQAAFQKYTDNAVSKTINFPHQAKPEEIKDAYIFA